MGTIELHRPSTAPAALVRPEPRSPIHVRKATLAGGGADMKFIDALQKQHSDKVGFLPFKQIEARISKGGVLIAEEQAGGAGAIGYVIFADKYMHREELGICYQLNIAPNKQRGLAGAALIQAAFEHCAYGTKLFCCWCAQDIEANHFWESIGFVPIAYRSGSRGKAQGGSRKDQRIHIFWQKRVREGDNGPPTGTPWWYPSETKGGAMKEGRIVLPIEPGTHWSDVKMIVLPGSPPMEPGAPTALPIGEVEPKPKRSAAKKPKPATKRPAYVAPGGLWVAPPKPTAEEIKAAKAAEPKPKREKQKNDPKLVAAAREFRDRYLDEVNSGRHMLESAGKYEVSRQLPPTPASIELVPLLNAA